DRLAPLVLQRCCGPGMWRALLRHSLLPPQTRRLVLPLRLLASCLARNFLAPLSPRPYAPQGVLAHGGRVVRTCLTSCEVEAGGAHLSRLGARLQQGHRGVLGRGPPPNAFRLRRGGL